MLLPLIVISTDGFTAGSLLTVATNASPPCVAATDVTVPVPPTAHVLSPLKKVDALGVPVADKSMVPMVTVPVAVVFATDADTKVPLALVNEATPPLPPAASIVNILPPLSVKVMLVPACITTTSLVASEPVIAMLMFPAAPTAP